MTVTPSRFALVALAFVAALGVHAPVAPADDEAAAPAEAPAPTATSSNWVIKRMGVRDLKARLDAGEKAVIVDVRPQTYGDLIKGSLWVPYMKIGQWAADHPRDELIVTYCACSHEVTSGRAVRTLNGMGFTNVWALQGGLLEWKAAGYPMQSEPTRPEGDAG